MATSIDGFYVSYFTGVAGTSLGLFLFKDGTVVGADVGGGRYDGTYRISEDGRSILAEIEFKLSVGHPTITGIAADAEPITISVPLSLPVDFNHNDVHRIETPIGPINAKLEKIRGA
jgi:hypothetical protein